MNDSDFERFNLRHLRYFLSVAETGSFRAASAALNIAQSAVSRRTADLERIFEAKLLDRLPRGVKLTPAGQALLEGALTISREIDAAHDTIGRYERGEVGTLSAGFFGSTARLSFLPPLVARFRLVSPQIKLQILPLPRTVADDAAMTNLDIAFSEERICSIERQSRCIFRGNYELALPIGHSLVADESVDFAELCNEVLIGVSNSTSPALHDRLVRGAAEQGRTLNIVEEAESESARLAFAAAGMGIALVSPLARNHDQDFAVEYRPISGLELPFEIWMTPRDHGSVALEAFVEIVTQLFTVRPALPA